MENETVLASIDESLKPNEYSGTFRWKKGIKMMPIDFSQIDFLTATDWKSFTEQLISTGFDDLQPIYYDSLSFGLTIGSSIVKHLEIFPSLGDQKHLNIVLFGCSSKAEERVARETNFFETVFYLLKIHIKSLEKVTIDFVGPEIESPTECVYNKISCKFYKDTAGNFLRENAISLEKENTVMFLLNPGFGAGFLKLTTLWVNDLTVLLKLGFLVISTYTNDYEDLKGEKAILNFLEHKPLIDYKNPFAFMTTMTGENQSNWSCGNFGVYSYKSCDKTKLKKKEKLDLAEEMKRILKEEELLK